MDAQKGQCSTDIHIGMLFHHTSEILSPVLPRTNKVAF